MDKPIVITGYDYKYLTSSEAKIIRILDRFVVMESRSMIEQWHEGGHSLAKYLSKLKYFGAFIGILQWCVTFVYFLSVQMEKKSLEERKKR